MKDGLLKLWFSEAIGRALNAASLVVVTHALGVEMFGIVGYVGAIAAYALSFVQFGTDVIIVRELVRGEATQAVEERKRELRGSLIVLRLGLLFLAIGGLGVCASSAASDSLKTLFLANIVFVAGVAFPGEAFLQSERRWGAISILRTIVGLLNLVGVIIFVRSSNDAWQVPFINGCALLSVQVILAIVQRRIFSFPPLRQLRRKALDLLVESAPVFGSLLLLLLVSNGGVLLLQWMRTPEDVGLYALSYRIFEICNVFLVSVGTVLYPRVAAVTNEGGHKERTELIRNGMRASFSLAVLIVGFIQMTASCLVPIIFGVAFLDSIPVLLILVPALLFRSISMFLANAVIALGAQRYHLMVTATVAGSMLVMSYLLIPALGAIGTAVAVMSSYSIELGLYAFVLRKQLQLGRIVQQGASILMLSGSSFVGAYLLMLWLETVISRDVAMMIGGIAFSGLFLFLLFYSRIITRGLIQNNLVEE